MFASFGLDGTSSDAPIDESTPWIAAGDGDLQLLQTALADLNLPVTAADSNGFTLVHAAASYSQIKVLRWLLSQEEIDVNAKDTDGDTPLHHCDDVDAARILVEEGEADFTIENEDGKTALDVKEEELAEGEERDDADEDKMEEDSDNEDRERLKALVAYLKDLRVDESFP